MAHALIKAFENNRVFTEQEAWFLFRLSAIGEACGWTMLITGLALKRYVLHGNNDPVLVAGQVHGMLFLAYAVAALGLYPALHRSRKFAFVALLASIPPYGSLVIEQWASRKRQASQLQTYKCFLLWTALTDIA